MHLIMKIISISHQIKHACIIACSNGQRIGRIADQNGTANINFVHFGSRDRLFKISLEPNPARLNPSTENL